MNSALAHHLWLGVQSWEYKKFIKACQNPCLTQERLLRNYIRKNALTEFGVTHHFERIRSYKEFIEEVPVREYQDFEKWIQKIVKGEKNILTKSVVIGFEKTSGTTHFSKLIPYTAELKQEFEKGIAAWLVSLQHFCPEAFCGCAYWALSPATQAPQKTAAGLPIGIEDDREYFHPFVAWILGSIMAVPFSLKRENDPAKFYLKTLEALLRREDLSFVSVWSPTFFLQLDNVLQSHKEHIRNWIESEKIFKNKRKARLLDSLKGDFVWKDLWPHLSVLSCWKDAQSEWWIPQVQKRAGKVWIQGKGLLATEGITSLPLDPQINPVLALRSHFYEFRSMVNAKICLAHELSPHERYEVLLTTAGGLYRYASGDFIEVTGFFKQAPAFRFVGRGEQQSDLVGEKLSEQHVLESFKRSLNDRIKFSLAFLYPEQTQTKAGYTLFIEKNGADVCPEDWHSFLKEVERSLLKNPYYEQAIHIGQLERLKIFFLPTGFREQLVRFLGDSATGKESTMKVPVLFSRNRLKPLLGV